MGRGRPVECSQFCILSHRDRLFQLTASGRNPVLQQLKTAEETQEKTEETKNLLEQLVSAIFEVVNTLTGVKISNLHILDITFEETSDGKGAIVKIPITAEVNVNLPLLGEIVDLDLNVDLQTSVSIETGDETSDSKVVVGECTNDPESISLTVLHSPTGLISDIRKTVTTLVKLVEDYLVQYVVSTPLLAAQSQARWGAGVTFPGLTWGGGEQETDLS
ncbi:unnamed protein product [Rangifer tarandus platyrhynchus]|uniref:Uncharacterized protein n=1 Tax=Rangifer tarandus platyrhynchus TaxID=3082113 RepID=A0AC59YAE0_RANTA